VLGLNPASGDSPKKGDEQKGQGIAAKKGGQGGKVEVSLVVTPTQKLHDDSQSQKSQDNGRGLDQADDGDASVHAGLVPFKFNAIMKV
jgi:hypothetical protein